MADPLHSGEKFPSLVTVGFTVLQEDGRKTGKNAFAEKGYAFDPHLKAGMYK